MRLLPLTEGWQCKQRNAALTLLEDLAAAAGWLPAQVPGTIHQDLLAAGRIPDPFVGRNEREVQWVGEADWLYRCDFDLPAEQLAADALDLCCDGLDTFATVLLNGVEVLAADNMFVPWRVPIKQILRPGRNELAILFESAWRRGKALESAHGVGIVWNTDASRVHVRKAQYHYGWDWGPCLITAGIWRSIRIEAYDSRIAELHAPPLIADDLQQATLPITVRVAPAQPDLLVRLALLDPGGATVAAATATLEDGVARHSLRIDRPQLWWPRGYGEQPLYRLEATLERDGQALDRQAQRIGLRRLRLVQEPFADEPGSSFVFEINHTPIFCGGANWIPADSFTPRITAERYRRWLRAAADANMVMLRIWGGGIYEEGVFYDLCDELGLLVWQDFMFACGIYPAYDTFQASVRAEAEANLLRLRHHPSIALWCGNNEDYSIALANGLYDAGFDGDPLTTGFPARQIYERLLPEICAALDPTRPYWPGSPWLGADPGDPTQGDRHTWDVWHGAMAPYQDFPQYGGRFVSEFGMQAAPDRATIESFAPPEERYAQSRTLEWHNKAPDGPRRLAVYLSDTLRVGDDLESYIYATQLVQAEALGAAYRGWRRRWSGPGRYAVAGALVWQLNDCWPVTSWAIIDYALRCKPAYYTIRRELAPLALGLARQGSDAELWAVNATEQPVTAVLHLSAWKLDGTQTAVAQRSVTLDPNRATELGLAELPLDETTVLAARLSVDDAVVARAALWPEPFKYLTLPDPGLELAVERDETLRISVQRPAKGVWLHAGDGVEWSDNMLDLFPDETRVLRAAGIADRRLRARWLGQS
jgi:beta-mannosidase